MKRTEWGLFTLAAGLAVLAFPPFFVELVAIYTLGGIGYLWRVLDERGRERLRDFERGVRIPYGQEKEGQLAEALEGYRKLGKAFQDTPPLLPIIQGRIKELEAKLAGAKKPPGRKRAGRRKG